MRRLELKETWNPWASICCPHRNFGDKGELKPFGAPYTACFNLLNFLINSYINIQWITLFLNNNLWYTLTIIVFIHHITQIKQLYKCSCLTFFHAQMLNLFGAQTSMVSSAWSNLLSTSQQNFKYFVNNNFLLRINHWISRKLNWFLPFFHEINLLREIMFMLGLITTTEFHELLLRIFKANLNTTQIVELYTSIRTIYTLKICFLIQLTL